MARTLEEDLMDQERVCENCLRDYWGGPECPICGHVEESEPRILTRMERHQAAADAGRDTWEDYRGER